VNARRWGDDNKNSFYLFYFFTAAAHISSFHFCVCVSVIKERMMKSTCGMFLLLCLFVWKAFSYLIFRLIAFLHRLLVSKCSNVCLRLLFMSIFISIVRWAKKKNYSFVLHHFVNFLTYVSMLFHSDNHELIDALGTDGIFQLIKWLLWNIFAWLSSI
jgi:hypothetical protein